MTDVVLELLHKGCGGWASKCARWQQTRNFVAHVKEGVVEDFFDGGTAGRVKH